VADAANGGCLACRPFGQRRAQCCAPMPVMTSLGDLWNRWLRFAIWLADVTPVDDRSRRGDGNSKALLVAVLALVALGLPAGLALLLPGDTSGWAAAVFVSAGWLFEVELAVLTGVRAQVLHESGYVSQALPNRQPAATDQAPTARLEQLQVEADVRATGTGLRHEEADLVAKLVRAEVLRGVRHLDRMGWLFAVIGFIVAVLVVVFGPYIPVLTR
jgi:hypothetical protein